MEKDLRKSNIELLRVVAMFLIIIGHYCYHGLKESQVYAEFTVTDIVGISEWGGVELLYLISCIAVNLYVMITGFFICDRLSFRWKGILKVWLQTVFYGILFVLFAFFTMQEGMQTPLFETVLPIYNSSYWFVTHYVGLMLIAPFLSLIVRSLSRQHYQLLLAIGGIMCLDFFYGQRFAGSMTIHWFIYLYVVSGYIKKYGVPSILERYSGTVFCIIVVLLFTGVSALNVFKNGGYGQYKLMSTSYDGPIFFLSVAAFIFFKKIDISKNRILLLVSRLAPYTFGIYLFHENPILKQMGLWTYLIPETYNIPVSLHCLIISVSIFFIGAILDYLRATIFRICKVDSLCDNIVQKLPRTL